MSMLANAPNDEKINVSSSPYNKSAGYRAILKNRNFLFLWLAQVFSQLGDRVIFVVFVAVIAAGFGASTSNQSLLYVFFTIPAMLFTAIAGVFVDKWSSKKVLIATNLLRAVFIGLLPFLNKSLCGIYALAFLISTATQFFVPAEASSIPALVKKHQLLAANSLFTTTMMASIIFGFVLGDPLINIFGLNSVHIAISALFIISAMFLTFIKINKKNLQSDSNKSFHNIIDDLKQGFMYIKANPNILYAMLKLAGLFSIIVMLSILAISISQQALYPDNAVLGAQKFVYIVASSGVGMVFGSLMVGKLWRNVDKYKLIYIGFLIIGINLLLLALIKLIPSDLYFHIKTYKLYGIYLAAFDLTFRMIYSYVVASIIGFGASMVAVPVQTILHTSIAESMRGKVFGIQFTMLSTSSTFPVLIAAFGADKIGVIKMLVIIGIPVILFAVYNFFKISVIKFKKVA